MNNEEQSAQLKALSDEELYAIAKKAWYRKPEDPDTAFRAATILAERENAGGMRILGEMYMLAEGEKKDLQKAQYYFTRGALLGDASCQICLADCYSFYQVEENLPLAVYWFQRAAEQGSGYACRSLGKLYDYEDWDGHDRKKALDWFMKGAAWEDGECLFELGRRSLEGDGVDQDAENGAKFLQRAAQLGNDEAQNLLGICYILGTGVEKDPEAAVAWIRKAAFQKLPVAMYNMGSFFERGWGVEKDIQQALRWYSLAKEAGYENAAAAVERLKNG